MGQVAEPKSKLSDARSTVAAIYDDKPASYFANARHDIVALLPTGPESSILELGCGAGGTGRAVLAAGKAGRYVGLELNEGAARTAAQSLTDVLVGDVETLDLSPYAGQFDALLISEVLEHLTDPWSTLTRLTACLKPGGAVFASSPNISHWQVIRDLALGRFDYVGTGVMDRTHLRWFTPASYGRLFEQAGVEVQLIRPLVPLRWKAKLINRLTAGRFAHLFMPQIMIIGRRGPDGPSA
jgi:2-polyprenyl-3-methyl-5-hydroxy-6-metoxy-1,4-benzoquinol methylase